MSDIIALMGSKGSGKDTVASYIKKNNTTYDKVVIMSFADALKDAVSDIFHFKRELLEGKTKESREWRETEIPYLSRVMNKPVTPRWLLQQIGANILRKHLYDDLWVDSVLSKINAMEEKTPDANYLYVITDCRFKNEIKKLELSGFDVKYVEVDRRNRNGYIYNWAYTYNNSKNPVVKLYCKYKLRKVHRSEWDWIGVVENPILIYNIGTLNNLEELVKSLIL